MRKFIAKLIGNIYKFLSQSRTMKVINHLFFMNLLARVTQTCPGKLTQRGEGHLQTRGGQQGHLLCQLEQKYNSLSMIWGPQRILTYWKLC